MIKHTGTGVPPELWYGGGLIATGNSPVSGTKNGCTVKIDHPYPARQGELADQEAYYGNIKGASTAIFYGLGMTSGKRLSWYQETLAELKNKGMSDFSREVLETRLTILGLNWILQFQMTDELLSSFFDTVFIPHHRVGIVKYNGSTMIDIPQVVTAYKDSAPDSMNWYHHFKAATLMASALEHGVIEQMEGPELTAASTVQLLKLANSAGDKIFKADSSTFSNLPLLNYAQSDLNQINAKLLASPGNFVILPEKGQLGQGQWKGDAYILKTYNPVYHSDSFSMSISGAYGGYCDYFECYPDPPYSGFCYDFGNWCEDNPRSRDPVDMLTGGFLSDSVDMTVGKGAPLELSFSRSYNSRNNNVNSGLGYGWTHNNDGRVARHSQPALSLGYRQVTEAAGMLAERFVTADLMKNEDTLLGWVIGALAANWSVEKLRDNAITASLGNKGKTFATLPDGSYSPPPGETAELIKNTNGTFSVLERLGNRIDFDIANRISQIADIDGNTVTYGYDAVGLRTITASFGQRLTINWTSGRISSAADSTGRVVGYQYDLAGNLTEYTDTIGKIYKYGYDGSHRLTTITNPLAVTTVTNTYDSLGRVITQSMPRQGGYNVLYNLYFAGFRNIEEDPAGSQTIYYFDDKRRSTGVENELGHKNTKIYDGQNHVVSETDRGGNSTTYVYDGNNNLVEVTNALNEKTVYFYDAAHRLTDITDPLAHITSFDYDTEHHLISTQDAENNSVINAYYPNGLKWTAKDARNTVTTFTYKSDGSPETLKTGNHPPMTYAYDAMGNMTSLTDSEGRTTSFIYDKRGLLTTATDPLGRKTKYAYDAVGNMTSRINRKNDKTIYTYTPTNKLERILYTDMSRVNFTYNKHDKPGSVQSPAGTTAYIYDAAHRVKSFTGPFGFTVGYLYYETGKVKEITYPGGKTVSYTYDQLNRLETVTNWLGQTATYYYDPAGRLTGIDNFNGTTTSHGYDKANRLVSLENRKKDSTVLATYQFILDGNGNRTQVIQDEPFLSLLSGASVFTYNQKKNRLLTAGGSTFSYDTEGRLYLKDGTPFIFDYENRLKSIGGASPAQYVYGGNGNRIRAVRNGIETRYIYDLAGNLIAEADSSNNITGYYIYGAGLLAMVTPADKVYTYHFKATGSTVAMTDENQQIVNSYSYSPFGNIDREQETIPQPFKYVGRYGVMSEPNGLYYMRARYYDPDAKRFISEDPIGFDSGEINLYVYVANNPVNFVDPWGLASLTVNANPRSPGSGSVSNSTTGHGWVTIANDDGTSTTMGNYPGGPRDDSGRVPTSSNSWEISQPQADLALTLMNQEGYNIFSNNCVDRVEDALDAAGISHPTFNTLGISDPARLNTWLNNK